MLTDKNTSKNRPIKLKWLERGMSDNRVLAIGVILFTVLMVSQIWHHRDLRKVTHDNAKLEAARDAEYLHIAVRKLIPLVEEGGGIIDEFLEPLSNEFEGQIRIIHSAAIDAQYGIEPHESPENDAEVKALQDGMPQEWETADDFIFIRPFKAVQFCQGCHHLPGKPDEPVPIGYVLGLIEVTVPKTALKEQLLHLTRHTKQSIFVTIILILLFGYGTYRAKIELGESEKKTMAIFKTVGEGIIVVGPDSIIRSTNHELCKIFGYSDQDLTGMDIKTLIPEKYRHNHTMGMKRYLLDGSQRVLGRRLELEGLRSDGTVFPIELRIEETLVEGGKDRFFIGAIRDITQRKESEEALLEAKEGLEIGVEERTLELKNEITERKSAEDKLQEEKNKLEATMGAMEMGLTIQNPNYEIIYQNKILTDAFGRLGEKCYRVYEGKDEICEGCPMEIAFKDGKSHTSERKVTMPSGEIAYWENTANPIRDASGNIVSCLEIARNITERKSAEEEVKASKRMLDTLFDNAPFMIWGTDEKGILNYFNKQSVEVMGYTHDEAIGMFNMKLHPPDEQDEVYRKFKMHVDGKMEDKLELPLYTKSGKRLIGSMAQAIYENELGKKLYFGFIEDITERKKAEEAILESEEKFRTLFEDSKDAVYITSWEGKYIDVNQAALDLFGYTKKKMLKINVLKTYVNPDDRNKFQEEIEEKGYVRDYEIQFQKKDGVRIDCLLTSSVRKDADGSILGYQGIIRDVTKEKILQQQLMQSEKLSSIGTFVAGVAHELNNPLTAVSLYSESLKEYDLPSGNAKNDLNIIIEQSRRASNIVQNLLKFSRKHKPGKSLCHINDILESVLSLQENHLRTDNIEIKREFANDIPLILADSNQLQQVIMNIILNAEHEMKKARGRGTITAKTEKKGKEIVITLENDGPPIPKDKLSSIFDPFYTTKDVGEGTGLGLYISFGIVKEHGGNMRVENIGKAGVRFVITLPISDKEPKSERDDAIEIKVPRGARILFVDDEKHIRDVMARNLLAEGMFVQVASNGKEAIELLEQNQFDVVISDVKMPNMSGMDVGKWLNKNKPDTLKRFILTTGALDPEIDNFCRQYGCDAITKPFEMEKLFTVIDRVLGK